MRSRVRFGLLVGALVFFLLGCVAISVTVLGLFTQVQEFTTAGELTDFEGPSKVSQVVSTLAPVTGALAFVLSALCVAGAIASWVATEAIDRAAVARRPETPSGSAFAAISPSGPAQPGGAHLSAPELLESE
jgi:hypothetical protein